MLRCTRLTRRTRGVAPFVVPPSSLLNNLVGYWSGADLNDSTAGARTLTNHGAATFTGGAFNLVAASSQYLSRASDSTLQVNGKDFTYAAVVKPTAATIASGSAVILAKTNGAGTFETYLRFASTLIQLIVSTDGSTLTTAQMSSGFVAGTSYLVLAWYDTVAQKLNLQINNGTVSQTAFTGTILAGTNPFTIGASADPASFWDGTIQKVAMWASAPGGGGVLTATQRTNLYNGAATAVVPWPFTGVP